MAPSPGFLASPTLICTATHRGSRGAFRASYGVTVSLSAGPVYGYHRYAPGTGSAWYNIDSKFAIFSSTAVFVIDTKIG